MMDKLMASFLALAIGLTVGSRVTESAAGRQAIERGYAEECGDSWEWVGECEEEADK